MLDRLRQLAGKARESAASAAVAVGDLNGDGVVDEKDAQIAADWARRRASGAADEASRIGQEALRSDMVKDAAAGAAVGAVVAIPLPVIGPVAGAVVGAGLGVYKNLTRGSGSSPARSLPPPVDLHAALLKLADLRDKGILTPAEFDGEKRKLLGTRD